MYRGFQRLGVLRNHLCAGAVTKVCSASTLHNVGTGSPTITVNPVSGMVDELVRIQVTGLKAKENVTLVAKLKENGVEFESRCVYQTDDHGCVDNSSSLSKAGSFTGVEPMGLFWSLKSNPETRLVKKDVTSPMTVNIHVYNGSHAETSITDRPLTETQLQRFYMKPGVRRIPLTGRFRGTVFVPEGEGPFPAMIDMYGGLVSLIETRAALLASHGYVTMALSYIGNDQSDDFMAGDFSYILDSYKWLMEQDYVDKKRLGAIGLCYGGTLSLQLAAAIPQIQTLVNVNGMAVHPGPNPDDDNSMLSMWPDKNRVFHTDEGFEIWPAFHCEHPVSIPAWQNGAKILIICGEDDKQVNPKWHQQFVSDCPDEFKSNIQLCCYQGAGHIIEPPFTPHIRSSLPGKKRMSSLYFIPEKYHETPMMAGGWTATHAHAQEDSWNKILDFLQQNLKS